MQSRLCRPPGPIAYRLLCGLLLLILAAAPALAADQTNTGTISGNQAGTSEDDDYDNQGAVTGQVNMTLGGHDVFTNSGGVGLSVFMSSDGSNTVENQLGGSNVISDTGTAGTIYGRSNSGGNNTVRNSGLEVTGLAGSFNEGDSSVGGSNILSNTGTVTYDPWPWALPTIPST